MEDTSYYKNSISSKHRKLGENTNGHNSDYGQKGTNGVGRKGHFEKRTFNLSLRDNDWRTSILSKGSSICKGPEVGTRLSIWGPKEKLAWPWFSMTDVEGPFQVQDGLGKEQNPKCHGPPPWVSHWKQTCWGSPGSLTRAGSEYILFSNLKSHPGGKQRAISPLLSLTWPKRATPPTSSELFRNDSAQALLHPGALLRKSGCDSPILPILQRNAQRKNDFC